MGIIENLILILLVLLWSAVAFTGGFLFCLTKYKGKEEKHDTGRISKSRDSPLTDEQERKVKLVKKQLQNFMLYDGTEQDDIRI